MKSLLKMTWMEAKLFLREPVGAFFTPVFPLGVEANEADLDRRGRGDRGECPE